jgi:soluble lytic murein transglycosylase-like protein
VLPGGIKWAASLALAGLLTAALPDAMARAQQLPPGGAVDAQRMFAAAARLYNLDPDLLAAIARVESGGNPSAISSKGAEGLMQLMPATALRFGVENPFDPIDNTLGAARFLSHLKQAQRRRSALALRLPDLIAAYNAGEGAVERYGGVPPYAETRQYVRKVLVAYLLADPEIPTADALTLKPPSRGAMPVLVRRVDALDELNEIRRLRALALSRAPRGLSR